LRCDLKAEVDFSCRTKRTLRCDLKTEVDFRMPRGADFGMRLKKSTLDCRGERTLDATTVVDFVPRGVDLRCKKTKSTFRKAKVNKKIRENK
jgi:hypothetical protein